MSTPDYWKIKATELEFQLARQQFQAILDKRNKLMKDSGFDINKNWQMNDETESITEASEMSNANNT